MSAAAAALDAGPLLSGYIRRRVSALNYSRSLGLSCI